MDLSLNEDERDLLSSILQESLSSLRDEIYKTEETSFKRALHERETLLRGLLSRLGPRPATGSSTS